MIKITSMTRSSTSDHLSARQIGTKTTERLPLSFAFRFTLREAPPDTRPA
jgi:hypothetical protein